MEPDYKTYRIEIKETSWGFREVRARNLEEAKEKYKDDYEETITKSETEELTELEEDK